MKARIYKPSKTAMQSGLANTGYWVLEYETQSTGRPEPLMGWTAAEDTLAQVRLKFPSVEEAAAYAEEKDLEYTIQQPRERNIRPRNYGDNFRYIPPENSESA